MWFLVLKCIYGDILFQKVVLPNVHNYAHIETALKTIPPMPSTPASIPTTKKITRMGTPTRVDMELSRMLAATKMAPTRSRLLTVTASKWVALLKIFNKNECQIASIVTRWIGILSKKSVFFQYFRMFSYTSTAPHICATPTEKSGYNSRHYFHWLSCPTCSIKMLYNNSHN